MLQTTQANLLSTVAVTIQDHSSPVEVPLSPVSSATSATTQNQLASMWVLPVVDTSRPTLERLFNVENYTCDQDGMVVYWDFPTATDAQDNNVLVTCTHQPGDMYRCGNTRVTCVATDHCDKTHTRRFWVKVRCRPVIFLSNPIRETACDTTNGSVVIYPVRAEDEFGDPLGVTCTHTILYGNPDFFECGTTRIICSTAESPCGRVQRLARNLILSCDNAAPTLTVSSTAVASCDNKGAVVNFVITAEDDFDEDIEVNCDHNPGDSFPCGFTNVACTAIDHCNHTENIEFTVAVFCDVNSPIVVVPDDITAHSCMPGGRIVTFHTNVSHEVQNDLVAVCTPASGDFFACGQETVTCEAIDECGQIGSASFDIEVLCDVENPSFSKCNPSYLVHDIDRNEEEPIFYEPEAEDNCGVPSVVCTPPSGALFQCGSHDVICTATDPSGNTETCFFTATVSCDPDAPRISCNNVDVVDCEEDGEMVTYDITAVDALGNTLSYVCDRDESTVFTISEGPQLITCLTQDSEGRNSSCTFFVDVEQDIYPPQFNGMFAIPSADSSECFGAVLSFENPAADDECGIPTVTCTPPSGSLFDCGDTSLECVATDIHGNNNILTTVARVNCESAPAPVISCPSNIIEVDLDEDGFELIMYTTPTANATCGEATVTCNFASLYDYPCGQTTVTCTAVDGIGHITSCSFEVFVICENGPPVLSCEAHEVIDCTEDDEIVYYHLSAVSADGATLEVTCNPPNGSVFAIGDQEVTCTTEDVVGNMATCTFTVSVILDNVLPVFTSSLNQTDGFSGDCSGDMIQYSQPAATDNCGPAIVTCTPPPGHNFPCGSTTVECVATDINGNTATQSVTNNVLCPDTGPPVIVCDERVTVPDIGDDLKEIVQYNTDATDDCGVPTIVCNYDNPDEFPCGETLVTCTATDVAGNTDNCQIVIEVLCGK
ncbi:hyalin-like [Ptychodera flava]|uniref:hyalin-like n=1 Tax=Ptychodera flava TaxID=63121 RepID=UPI00396A2F5F